MSAPSSGGRVLVEDHGRVRVLVLSNPAKRNAVDAGMLTSLEHELERAQGDQMRCLVLRGEGDKAYCAGYDLSALPEVEQHVALPDHVLEFAVTAMDTCPLPIISAINGAAFGAGCELAAASDFRIASRHAVFGLPPAKLGIVYMPAGLWRVQQLVGASRARRLFFTGDSIDAQTALDWGFVDELHDGEEAFSAALALASKISENAPLAVQGMRRIFAAMTAPPLSHSQRTVFEVLRREAFESADAREGRAAFLAKRPARFVGE